MPTVIDSFVIELGLDPSKFTKGQKEALEAFKKTQEEARKSGTEFEERSRRTQEAMSGIQRGALVMLGALAGTSSIIGFASAITQSDAALGRLSRNIGVSVPEISKWQGVARQAGGSAESMAASFTQISDAFAGWQIGKVSPLIADLRAISTAGGTTIDVNKGVVQSFLDLSANLKAIHDRNPAQAGLLGRTIGLDPHIFDVLIKGREATQKMLDDVSKLGGATKESAESAAALQKEFSGATIALEDLGRKMLQDTGPALVAGFEAAKDGIAFIRDNLRLVLNLMQLVATPGSSIGGWINRRFGITESFKGRHNQLMQNLTGRAPETPPVGAPASTTAPLRTSPTAGKEGSVGLMALARSLQESIPDLDRVTGLKDRAEGKHGQGLALDFTIKDKTKSEAVAAQIRAKLASMGVGAYVQDEYVKPSKNATGPHIHVQFNSPADAQKYANATAGLAPAAGGATSNSTKSTEVNIQTMNVNAPNATDVRGVAEGFAGALKPILEGTSSNMHGNGGGE